MKRVELVTEERDGFKLVAFTGELDTFGAKGMRGELGPLRDSDRVVIDLGQLSFVDSAGLHALFGIGREAKEVGARLVFVVPAESPIRRVIELVQLAEISPVFEETERAVEVVLRDEAGDGDS